MLHLFAGAGEGRPKPEPPGKVPKVPGPVLGAVLDARGAAFPSGGRGRPVAGPGQRPRAPQGAGLGGGGGGAGSRCSRRVPGLLPPGMPERQSCARFLSPVRFLLQPLPPQAPASERDRERDTSDTRTRHNQPRPGSAPQSLPIPGPELQRGLAGGPGLPVSGLHPHGPRDSAPPARTVRAARDVPRAPHRAPPSPGSAAAARVPGERGGGALFDVSFFSSPCPAPCSGVAVGSFRGLSRPRPSVRPHQRGSLADLSLLSFTKKPAPDSQCLGRPSLRGPPPPSRSLPCRVTAHGGGPAPDPGI